MQVSAAALQICFRCCQCVVACMPPGTTSAANPALLVCREPHVESALVYGIRGGGLLVFVPAYHLRGAVHLTDRRGAVVTPLTGEDDGDSTDAFARLDRRSLRLEEGALLYAADKDCKIHHDHAQEPDARKSMGSTSLGFCSVSNAVCTPSFAPTHCVCRNYTLVMQHNARRTWASRLTRRCALLAGEDHARIVDDSTGAVLLDVRPMQRVWVRLGAQASRSHGPTLRIQLLAPDHPDAIKVAAAAQSRPHDKPVRQYTNPHEKGCL